MKYKRVEGIPWQFIDNQTIIIDPQTQQVHELDEIGSLIWQKLDGSSTPLDISQEIQSQFQAPEDIVQDVEEFCQNLQKQGLIE